MHRFLELSTPCLEVKHTIYLQDIEDMNAIIAIADKQLSMETSVEDYHCISDIKKHAEQHKLLKADAACVIEKILDIRKLHDESDESEEEELFECREMAAYWHWINETRDDLQTGKQSATRVKELLSSVGLTKEEMAVALGHVYGKCKEEIVASTEIARDSFNDYVKSLAKKLYSKQK